MYSFVVGTYRYKPSIYRYILSLYLFSQHAHIENIKTVANLTNNKDVFMCILRFHARAGYLQTTVIFYDVYEYTCIYLIFISI